MNPLRDILEHLAQRHQQQHETNGLVSYLVECDDDDLAKLVTGVDTLMAASNTEQLGHWHNRPDLHMWFTAHYLAAGGVIPFKERTLRLNIEIVQQLGAAIVLAGHTQMTLIDLIAFNEALHAKRMPPTIANTPTNHQRNTADLNVVDVALRRLQAGKALFYIARW